MKTDKLVFKCEQDMEMYRTLTSHLHFLQHLYRVFEAFNNPSDKKLIHELSFAIEVYHRLLSAKAVDDGVYLYDIKIATDQLSVILKDIPPMMNISRNIIMSAINDLNRIKETALESL